MQLLTSVSLKNVDYPELIWEDFAFKINHMVEKQRRRKNMPYPSRRVIKKKVIISADDNFIPEPNVALELGKSMSSTKDTEEEATWQVHATHKRIVTESDSELARRRPSGITFRETSSVSKKMSPDPSQKLKGILTLTLEEKLAANTMQALKANKKTIRSHPHAGGSIEGTVKEYIQDDDEKTDDELVHGDEQVNDDEDEEMTNVEDADTKNGDEEITDAAKADVEKAEEQVHYKEIIKEYLQANVINEVKNQLLKFLPKAVCDFATLVIQSTVKKALEKTPRILDDAIACGQADPKKVMRKRDPDDEDPLAGPNQEELVFKMASDDIEQTISDVANDADQPTNDLAQTKDKDPKKDWFKQPLRPPTPNPKWNKRQVIDDQHEQPWLSNMVSVAKDLLTFDELMATLIYFSKYAMN
nr:hypothetical protein [Tanacetum cinerariifolium]